MEPSDETLVLSCRAGDEAAWETLIARYQRLIYAIPRRAGLDEDLSAEVFQQVFTALFDNLDRIKQPEQIHAWLVTTARRSTLRLLHRERERLPGTRDDPGVKSLEVPDDAPLPDEVILRLELQHKVRTAVSALDERCRELLTLLFYRDDPPSYSEIAATLGVAEGSIGPTRARCLQKLLRLLGDSEA